VQDDIVDALEQCDHDFEAAAAWLLGERGEPGIDDEGPMYDEGGGSLLDNLMSEPRLQQALSNPNVVSALQVSGAVLRGWGALEEAGQGGQACARRFPRGVWLGC
jgi:hypothetical protein